MNGFIPNNTLSILFNCITFQTKPYLLYGGLIFCSSGLTIVVLSLTHSLAIPHLFFLFPLHSIHHKFAAFFFLLKLGAAAVNLVGGDKPADVYSGIAAR